MESKLATRLRSLRIPRAASIAKEIVPSLMEDVPSEAFDCRPSWEYGALFMHGEVTEEYMKEMQDEILGTHYNIKPGLPLTLYLSSIGGEAYAGASLFSTIQEVRRAGRKVNCHINGVAMSMGSIIAQACDTRLIEPFAFMMIHEVSDFLWGKTLDMTDQLAFNKKLETTLCGFYATRSGKPLDYWMEKIARRDWYMTAYEAVREGLADKVTPIPKFAKKAERKKAAPPDANP